MKFPSFFCFFFYPFHVEQTSSITPRTAHIALFQNNPKTLSSSPFFAFTSVASSVFCLLSFWCIEYNRSLWLLGLILLARFSALQRLIIKPFSGSGVRRTRKLSSPLQTSQLDSQQFPSSALSLPACHASHWNTTNTRSRFEIISFFPCALSCERLSIQTYSFDSRFIIGLQIVCLEACEHFSPTF